MDILSIRGFIFRSRLIQHCTREFISKGKPQSSIEWKTRTRVTRVSRSQSCLASLQESLQETAVGSSREEDCPQLADYTFCRVSLRAPDVAPVLEAAEESSVLSSEEVPHIMDQDCRVIT